MQATFLKPAGVSLAALAAVLGASWANAQYLPITNGDFSNVANPPKATFTSVNPTGWTYTAGGGNLVFIAHPCEGSGTCGTTADQSAAGPVYLTTYANPTDLTPSVFLSSKSNYVEADGNPVFEDGFQTTITGLTPGKAYALTFYQGASQQLGFGTPGVSTTTDQWIVSLGTQGLQVNCSTNPCTYYNNDPHASIKESPLMTVTTGTAAGWEAVSLGFVADASTQELSFLAWGDDGSTVNEPPIAFLTNVNSPNIVPTVPEPSTWAMMILGFLGVGGVAWRRAKRPALAAQGSSA